MKTVLSWLCPGFHTLQADAKTALLSCIMLSFRTHLCSKCLYVPELKPLPEPPTFVKKMEPKFTWKQGISARLQCSVKGSPELHIHWFWNEHELNDGEKYKLSFKNGVAILEILNLVVANSGRYSCEVSNNAGSESCSTLVAVKGSSCWIHSSSSSKLALVCNYSFCMQSLHLLEKNYRLWRL